VDSGQALTLPRNLAQAAGIFPDPGRDAWIATLPMTIETVRELWALDVGEPFQPGGRCSWTAPARTPVGEDVVVKVGWSHEEARHEADVLRLWNGDGAVRLIAAEQFDSTSALLLERCVPGAHLGSVRPEPEQDVVLARLLRRLWVAPPAGHPFRPLADMCEMWIAEFEQKIGPARLDLDPGLVSAGVALFRSLGAPSIDDVVLCTDLHPENILSGEREPWLAIDPKPYVGDPAYDVLQHLLNVDRLRTEPVRLVRRMADLTDLDPERVQTWAFARFVIESVDKPWLTAVVPVLAP
jgi:streptomycin 6-kinase